MKTEANLAVMNTTRSRAALNFFRSYFHFCLSSVHYCEDRFHIHSIILLYRIKEYQNLSRFKSLISSPRSELTIFIFTVIEINEMTILLST